MLTKTFSINSRTHYMQIDDINNLNLPDAPDFISKEPDISYDELILQCEKMLPHWNKIRLKNPPPKFIGEPFRLIDL